jgi:hypothetical protein
MVKQFKVTYFPNDWACTIEIDENYVIPHLSNDELAITKRAIVTMVEFWTGWEDRLDRNDGDYVKTFVQQLAREIVYITSEDRMAGTQTIIKEFENREGWCLMDGSYGIKILSIDDFDLDYDQFEVEEVAA